MGGEGVPAAKERPNAALGATPGNAATEGEAGDVAEGGRGLGHGETW